MGGSLDILSKFRIRVYAKELLNCVSLERNGLVVVQAGDLGCLLVSHQLRNLWLPPAHTRSIKNKDIIDGAESMFVGALAYAMATGRLVVEAAKLAMVAASFRLECPAPEKERPKESLWDWERYAWERAKAKPPSVWDLPLEQREGKEYWYGQNLAEKLEAYDKLLKM
ncbi:hypothetical protein MFIFM68171_08221 [Madurella fahalii]|uniref:Uncharacterized protein n=1 Tax=Madurella fahalii TaxID=1157608 RepID=A0ABQ0GJU9_9PEZI